MTASLQQYIDLPIPNMSYRSIIVMFFFSLLVQIIINLSLALILLLLNGKGMTKVARTWHLKQIEALAHSSRRRISSSQWKKKKQKLVQMWES